MGARWAADVRAAGAVVWRRADGPPEVAVVHRPRYDDWSLPKGKLGSGEKPLLAAVREVCEETGSTVAVSRRLASLRYEVEGARKQVDYWLARHVDGMFHPGDEVDALAWLSPAAARDRLSYAGEQRILADLDAVPAPESTLILVRHARAGKRAEWSGADVDRPLDNTGRRQAQALITYLGAFGPTRVVSAPPARCVQTVTPLADALGLDVEIEPDLGDEGFAASAERAEQVLLGLARPGSVTVVASQGSAIPGLLERVWPAHRLPDTKKGHAWVLGVVDGAVMSADHYADAAR